MARRPDLGYFDEGLDLLDPASYAGADGRLGEARTIAPLVYRSLAFAYLEDEAIWTRDWVCVGTRHDVAAVGDLLPFTVGHHGIHVQRMPDGRLEGRFNKAQHGGCRVVPVQCQGGTKTKCSFTSCGYSRDRDAIPAEGNVHELPVMHQYLGLRPERLFRVAVAELGPMIFVHLDPAAAVFAPEPKLRRRIADLFGEQPKMPRKEWVEFDANWKLVAQALAASDDAPESLGGAVAAARIGPDADPIVTLWLFPNAVILAVDGASAIVVLQQTATEKTLCRVNFIGQAAGIEILRRDILEAGAVAEGSQMALGRAQSSSASWETQPVPPDAIGLWAQATLIERILAMPRDDLAAPLFRAAQHYSI